MKKSVFVVILSIAFLPFANGQMVKLTIYVESTHVSPKSGLNIRYEDPYLGYEIGVFYQESRFLDNVRGTDVNSFPRSYEKMFTGLYLACPIMQRDWLDLKFNVRTGVTNNETFVITPMVTSDLKLAPFLQIGGGIGTRSFRPTFMTHLTINI